MLDLVGKDKSRTRVDVTRRDFLKVGTLGAIGLSLPAYLEAKESGAIDARRDERACIMIFNVGAPSQLDTFDMKPEAPLEIRGPFRPIPTASPEIQLSELFPWHARVADKFSLVRSCHHGAPAVHDAGWQAMQTGRLFAGGVQTPHLGAAASYLRGQAADAPPFVVLPETMGRGGGNLPNGQSGGFLGPDHDPFTWSGDAVEIQLDGRRPVREIVDGTLANVELALDSTNVNRHVGSAFEILASARTRLAWDLTREAQSVRERYGMTRFGQSCLLARRLVEGGARFVTINTFLTVFDEVSWDIHGMKPFTTVEGMRDVVAPMYDQAYGALIDDLHQRGMLENTLVCNLAEFGRTPRMNAAGGRDHWPQCFTCCFAGGGVQGGRVVGRSDSIGGEPVDRPVEPADIAATIFHSLGFNLDTRLPGPDGKPLRLVDPGHREIHELFA